MNGPFLRDEGALMAEGHRRIWQGDARVGRPRHRDAQTAKTRSVASLVRADAAVAVAIQPDGALPSNWQSLLAPKAGPSPTMCRR